MIRPIIFVIGHERSGTSLVRAILDVHGDFALPPNDADLLLLLEERETGRGVKIVDLENLKTDGKLQAWNLDLAKIQKSIGQERSSVIELYRLILNSFWQRNPGKIQALKRPKYEHRIGQIRKIFPQSKFIALIRDPRAVLASKKYYGGYLGKGWNIINLFYLRLITSIIRWKFSENRIREEENRLGVDCVLVVKYEELIVNPSSTIRKIFDFIGVTYQENKLFAAIKNGFHSNSTFLEESTSHEVFKKEAIDRWKEKLSSLELKIIEKTLVQEMTREEMILCSPQLNTYSEMLYLVNYCLYRIILFLRKKDFDRPEK